MLNIDQETVTHFMRKLYADAQRACDHMDPEQLTNNEKVGLAVLSGVPYITRTIGIELKVTTYPCTFAILDGKWVIYWKDEHETENNTCVDTSMLKSYASA